MGEFADLFDRRSIVGRKLENIILERGYTKKDLCEQAGLSRPTLDKLLAGTLTSKTYYEKHIAKVLEFLLISPGALLGNTKNQYNRTRELMAIMKVSSEQVSKATNIPLERLCKIESGEEASLAELRDIAMCFSVSVRCLKGENFFEPQISQYDMFVRFQDESEKSRLSGFWGHVGVSLHTSQMLWFPITSSVRKMIYNVMSNDRVVVPCMDNRLLYLNMQHVKEIVLLDDDCDPPQYVSWDYNVSNGEIPLVIYEALEDYIFDEMDQESMSEKLKQCLKDFMEKHSLSGEEIEDLVECSRIYYADGSIRHINIDFQQEESISEEIETVYLYEETEYLEKNLYCTDIGGAEVLLNMKNIAMMELPLLKVENKICETRRGDYE